MASGDTVMRLTDSNITANDLTFRSSVSGTQDSGSFNTSLAAGGSGWVFSGNSYSVQVTVKATANATAAPPIGPPSAIGHPPFDPTKTYDVLITEH